MGDRFARCEPVGDGMDDLLNKFRELQSSDAAVYGVAALAALASALAVLWAVRKLLGRRKPEAVAAPDLRIDVEGLGDEGPPAEGPSLEYYYTPVRLAAVVLAPAGRSGELSPDAEWDPVLEAVAPGLAQVVAAHRSRVYRWPAQLSTRGFAHTFFAHARLPGDAGRDTPWASVAGAAKMKGRTVMVGLVLRTRAPTSHGQETLERPEAWLRVLQVKGA